MPVRRRLIRIVLSAALLAALAGAWISDGTGRSDAGNGEAIRAQAARHSMRPRRTLPPAAGRMLVAARGLTDPNFARSVVLLIEHGSDGAAGLIVNVRSAVPIASLFDRLKLRPREGAVAFFGGPVAPRGALALDRSRPPESRARSVIEDISLVTNRAPMEDRLAAGAGADEFRVYLGHAGWTAGQLEREIALDAWHVFNADASVVFDADPSSVWQRQIRRTELLEASMPRAFASR
jgi:putative transcriptional regulator